MMRRIFAHAGAAAKGQPAARAAAVCWWWALLRGGLAHRRIAGLRWIGMAAAGGE